VASPNPKPDWLVDPNVGPPPDNWKDVNGFVPTGSARSGILEAWRQIYYEEDRVPNEGAIITADAAQGQNVVWVSDDRGPLARTEGWQYPFDVAHGVEVFLFDAAAHDPWARDPATGRVLRDPVSHEPVASRRYVVDEVQDLGDTLRLTLTEPLDRTYSPGGTGHWQAGIAISSKGYRTAVDAALLSQCYGQLGGGPAQREAFVLFSGHPLWGGDQHGVFLAQRFGGWSSDHEAYFDGRAEPNVVCMVHGGEDFDPSHTGENDTTWLRFIIESQSTLVPHDLAEFTAHEAGHLFALTDYTGTPQGHTAHRNWADTDGCTMVYDYPDPVPPPPGYKSPNRVRGDGIALLGGLLQPPAEPMDLLWIAGQPDRLVRTSF